MTKQELKAKIDKLENGIKSKATPSNLIAPLKAQKAKLEKELQDMEASEKKAVKTKKVSKVAEKIKAAKKSVAKKTSAKAPAKEERKKDNIARDGDRKSLPAGKRVSKTGKVYYETRVNRSDKQTYRKPYLADGGETEGWNKTRTRKLKTKEEAENAIEKFSQLMGKAGRNYKVEKMDDGYTISYESKFTGKMADGGILTDAKKEAILKKKGNIIIFKEVLEPTDEGRKSIAVQRFVKSRKTEAVKLEGSAYDTQWFESMQDLINAVDWSKWENNKYAKGGETDWGADLGGGFSIGNDVYITDSKSLFQGKTGFVSGSVGRDLLVTIMDNGNERSVVVSKKGVEKLDAPEYVDGGNIKSENELKNKNMNYAEGGELNLAVRKMASQKGLTPKKLGADYELTMAQAAVDALTDANYHDAARKLVSILENKPEIAEKPDYPSVSDPDFKVKMGAINEKYDSKYWHGDEKTRDFAVKVSQSSGWDGNGIAGAFEYLLRMEGYHRLADKIKKSVELSDADKIADFAYTNDIYATGNSFEDFSRRVKEKSGINYSEDDLQIAYNLLSNARYAKGGYMGYGGKTKSRKSMKDLTIEQISSMTGVGKAGIERFSDENNLSEEDLSNIMQGLGRRMISASDFATAVSGNKDNQYTKEIVDFAKSGKGYKMADGGMIYKMADNMTDAEYEKKLSSLNEKQKKTYESLVRLGDSPKLALATTLLSNEAKWSDDTTRAYTMASGGEVPAHFGSGKNIDVFGYQTQNFDICGTAVKEFESAVEIMQNAKETYKESLARCAKYVDGLFGTEKLVVENSGADDANFYEAVSDIMSASIYNYRAEMSINLFSFVPQHLKEIAVRMAKAEKGGFYALGGMTAGRWYRDKSGEEFKFIGKIDSGENKGKFLFTDGQKSVYKDLEDFEGGRPKETKLFGFFEDGGSVAEGNYEMLMSNIKAIKHHAEELEGAVNPNTEIEAWVLSKSERAETDLSDITHYLDGLKMAKGGYMADGGKLSKKSFFKKYEENEDQNMHSENVVLLAENYGTESDIRDAKIILAKHEAIGHLPTFLREERDNLHDKLWSKYIQSREKGGYMADGGFFDTKGDVKFKFSENEKIKVLQYDSGRLKKLGATIIEQYAAEQPDGTYYPFYWVVGDWESMEEGKKHPSLYAEDELIERHGNKPKKMADGGYMAKGGKIKDQYEGKTASEVWGSWNEKQRSHFLLDHSELLDKDRMENNLGYSRTAQKDKKYEDLTPLTKRVLEAHVNSGQYADGGMMAKGGEIAFDNSNLYLNGFGMDSNGNSVVKVSFPNQRAFSIQTNGVLKETNSLYTKKIGDLSEAQIKTIEKEVVDYVKQFGSKDQKQRLKTYSGYMAKGGVMPKGARSGMKIKDWYIKNYPTDELGKEINDTMTFRGFWALTGQGNNPYEVLGVHDSVVRERVEEKLSQILGKKEMAKGGIYSSDSLYILKVSKDGKEVGEERFRAKNIREAKEMGEDYEEKYKTKFGGDLSFSVKEAMASGGMTRKGGQPFEVEGRKFFYHKDDGNVYDSNHRLYAGSYSSLELAKKSLEKNFENIKTGNFYKDGGKVKFADKVKSVQESLLKRKKVSPKVQKDYGKTYSKAEAKESAQRIVGSRMAQLKEKMGKKKK